MWRRNWFESFPNGGIENMHSNHEYKKSSFFERARAFPDIMAIWELDSWEIIDVMKETLRINLREQVDWFNLKLIVGDLNNIVSAFRAWTVNLAIWMLTEFLFEKIGKRFPLVNIGEVWLDLVYQLILSWRRKRAINSRQWLRNDVDRQNTHLTTFDFRKTNKWGYNAYEFNNINKAKWWFRPRNVALKLGWNQIGIPVNIKIQLSSTLMSPALRWLDCIRFAHFVAWKYPSISNTQQLNPSYQPNINPGSVIVFTDNINSLTQKWTCWNKFHFATYIWQWLYISKPGRMGPVLITNFSDLRSWPSRNYNQLYLMN